MTQGVTRTDPAALWEELKSEWAESCPCGRDMTLEWAVALSVEGRCFLRSELVLEFDFKTVNHNSSAWWWARQMLFHVGEA